MIVSPVFKKGDRLLRENFLAIPLFFIPGKIFLRILLNRMNLKLRETQYGCRAGRGTVDAIFIVRQIIKKARGKKVPLNFNFIDFKADFDKVWRKELWRMLRTIWCE